MTYNRVIPRDLFNEGNLLKCLGMLYIATERMIPLVRMLHTGNEFHITQSDADGSIRVGNISILIGGTTYDHYRPLNSKEPWPLYIQPRSDPDADAIEVFDEKGSLSVEMLLLLAMAE